MAATSVGGFSGRFFSGLLADTIGWRNGFIDLRRRHAAPAASRSPRSCRASATSCAPKGSRRPARQMLRPSAQSAPARDLRGRLRHAVQFRRAVHLCELRARRAAVQSVADAARRDLRHLSGRRASRCSWLGRAVARFGRRTLILGTIAVWICGALLTLVPSLWAIIAGLAIAAGVRLHHAGDLDRLRGADGAKAAAPRRSGSMRPAFMSAAASARSCRD